MDALELLSGDAQTFVEKVWASRPHVHRTAPAELAALLSLDDVDRLLTSSALRTPALRLAQGGSILPASRYTRSATLAGTALTGLVDARKVFDLFDGGATVVLQGLHRYWPALTDLVRGLEAALGHPCQANAYLTPPGSQGFARHSDTHDVFVLQTFGRKLWEIDDAGDRQEVLLEPGTSMYLPTGTPHAARTQESASLHVTVGINRITWRRLLEQVTRAALATDTDPTAWDQPLPAGYLDDPEILAAGLADRVDGLVSALRRVDPVAAAREQAHSFLTSRPPLLRGGLTDRLAVADLHDESVVTRRPGSICVPAPAGERLRLLLGDRELTVPAFLGAAVEHIRQHPTLRPADLAPWLDPESRLVLVRRLVREGLLRVTA